MKSPGKRRILGRAPVLRALAGSLAVAALQVLARLPLRFSSALGTLALPFYLPFRRRARATLHAYCPRVTPLSYYRVRLRLALLSLKHATNRADGCRHEVAGSALFSDALASGRPVVLLGWHQGPVELLHKIPSSHFNESVFGGTGRVFSLMTASAFSPALAEWMTTGRRGGTGLPTRVIRPGDTAALREWVRTRGVLAVMVDQVPGAPEDWLTPGPGAPALPWPRRLMEWILAHDATLLAVSAVHERGGRILFRYHRIPDARDHESVKQGVGVLMRDALARAPEQYNWSYGKFGRAEGESVVGSR